MQQRLVFLLVPLKEDHFLFEILPELRGNLLVNPTGGVNLENAGEFIKAGASIISVGSALVDKKAVAKGKFEVLTRKAREFVEEVRKARSG